MAEDPISFGFPHGPLFRLLSLVPSFSSFSRLRHKPDVWFAEIAETDATVPKSLEIPSVTLFSNYFYDIISTTQEI